MRKNPWMENSIENLIPLSEATDFKQALKEWEFTGEVIDYEVAEETCELCEHEKLRYHFEIKNTYRDNRLWVGSSCIMRFEDIAIYDNTGVSITDNAQRKQELEKALKEKQIHIGLQPLRELWKKDIDYRNYIHSNVEHFKSKGGYLPFGLAILCARMKSNGIEFKPSMFPVYLRTNESKNQLSQLNNDLLENVKLCMSKEQRAKFFNKAKNI